MLPSRFYKNASHASHASHSSNQGNGAQKVSENASHASHASPNQENEQKQPKWVVVESELLSGERIAIVGDKDNLAEAQKALPGMVLYFLPEIEALAQLKEEMIQKNDADGFDAIMRITNKAKKEFGGWCVPSLFKWEWKDLGSPVWKKSRYANKETDETTTKIEQE